METHIFLFFIVSLIIIAILGVVFIVVYARKKQSDSSFIHWKDEPSHYDFPFHQLTERRMTVSPRGLFIIALEHIHEAGLNGEEAAEFICTFFSVYMKKNSLCIVNDSENWILLFKEREELPENL